MNCYQCGQPPVGACVACGKFYCDEHGHRFCLACLERKRRVAVGRRRVARGTALAAAFVLLVGGLVLLTMSPVNPTTMLLAGVAMVVGCIMTVLAYKIASWPFP
jgi:1,4-dihydroxy-2-naphthoate octaprenyltransferase